MYIRNGIIIIVKLIKSKCIINVLNRIKMRDIKLQGTGLLQKYL